MSERLRPRPLSSAEASALKAANRKPLPFSRAYQDVKTRLLLQDILLFAILCAIAWSLIE